MIDPTTEEIISVSAAGRYCACDGRSPSPVTLWRWATKGCGKNHVRLETIRIGGRTCTSREALQRFLEALNPELVHTQPARTPNQRRRAAERAAPELKRLGV